MEEQELGLWRTQEPFRGLPFVCLQPWLLTNPAPLFILRQSGWEVGTS